MATVFTRPLPDVEIPPTTITAQVFRHASRLADRDAVVDGLTGRSAYSFRARWMSWRDGDHPSKVPFAGDCESARA